MLFSGLAKLLPLLLLAEVREMPELLTAEQVGQVLQRHPRTVMALVKDGKLSAVRIGPRGVRFTQDDVRRFIERSRTGAD